MGAIVAGFTLHAARGLSLSCSHRDEVCTLREDYAVFARARRFVHRREDPVQTRFQGGAGGTSLVVLNAQDRSGAAFTRPRPPAEADAIGRLVSEWTRDPLARDAIVAVDAAPDHGGVLWACLIGFAALVLAASRSNQRLVEVRPSEQRLVIAVRGPWSLYRPIEVASVPLSELAELSLTSTRPGKLAPYAVAARLRSGERVLLTSHVARYLAERYLATVSAAVAGDRTV